ncbi:DUF4145 domain-containing protein [Maricaulis sp.]|uniref:DUF4145 domain-containing protein n=1 Tax=Maricaulis sp. TaxID=1486257 RepID=UPI003A8F8030
MTKAVEPATNKLSFSCPHCGAIAHQTWFDAYAKSVQREGDPIPGKFGPNLPDELERKESDGGVSTEALSFYSFVRRSVAGEVFLWPDVGTQYVRSVENIHFSQCYSCEKWTLWVAHEQAWPEPSLLMEAADDMPTAVRRDFDEARAVVGSSPRAAAALLRVAIERLCNEINNSNDTINDGIAKLVRSGLDERIQRALDIVRVTGNAAVHPGQIDMADDREAAITLFKLVNLVVERLITQPHEIDDL